MKRTANRLVTSLAVVTAGVFMALPASAGLVQLNSVADLTADDSIQWSALGGDLTSLTPPTALTTANSASATLTGSSVFTVFLGSTYNADFAAGDTVVSAYDLNNGPLSTGIEIDFANPVYALGALIQANAFGAFTGTLQAYDSSSTLLGTVTVNSTVLGSGSGAPFLGASTTGNLIAKAVFSTDVAGAAIDTVSIQTSAPSSATPEPSAFVLMFSSVAALGFGARRRFAR